MPLPILVTGASGTTGRELIRCLLDAGNSVRALIRKPEKRAIIDKRADTVIGSFVDPESLEEALEGMEKAYLCISDSPKLADLNRNFIEAAQAKKIKHMVRLSGLGASPASPNVLAKLHGEADHMLQESGIPYTILRPHFFMQNMFLFAGSIKKEGNIYARMKNGRISLVDAKDVAAAAAAVLCKAGHEYKTYDLTGPEALSFQDIAEKLTGALGLEIRYIDISPDAAKERMVGIGFSEWFADAMIELFGVFSAGYASTVTDAMEKILLRPPTSFDEFARRTAKKFR